MFQPDSLFRDGYAQPIMKLICAWKKNNSIAQMHIRWRDCSAVRHRVGAQPWPEEVEPESREARYLVSGSVESDFIIIHLDIDILYYEGTSTPVRLRDSSSILAPNSILVIPTRSLK